MRVARFVRTFWLLLLLGLAGSAGGCGPGSQAPTDQQRQDQIKESKKTGHRQIKEDSQKVQEATRKGPTRKGARRGQAGD